MKNSNRELLSNTLNELNIDNIEQKIDMLDQFMQLVVEWNNKINLTSILEEDDFVLKHFIDSLVSGNIKALENCKSVIDIGTGAGFPGIPLAIVYDQKEFVLLDSLNKRIKFIDMVTDTLGINNVRTIHGRAEDFGHQQEYREQFDLCVSRAVARLNILGEYCIPFVKVGGYFAAYKGSQTDEEINESKKAINILGGELISVETPVAFEKISEHKIVLIKKQKNTQKKYPRKAGTPSKNPL